MVEVRMKPKKKKSSVQCCEFFKVYHSNFSSKTLGIPKAAVRFFNRTTKPKDVVLKDDTGGIWLCKMKKVEEGLAIEDGWQRFAHQYALEDGDFLTFGYNGDSLLDVKVYGVNGAKKKEIARNSTHVTEGTKTESAAREEATEQTYGETECSTNTAFSHTCQAKPKGTAQEHKASPRSKFLQKVHFSANIKATSTYQLHIPLKAVKTYGIRAKQILIHHDENGKKWSVRVTSSGRGTTTTFSRGWNLFFRENNLKPLDTCLFEFVTDGGSISQDLKVQILRRSV